jgi:hypothetical protein
MSLILSAIIGGALASRGKDRQMDADYLLGCDVLGADELGYAVPVPAEAPKGTAFIQSRTGAYLTSVAAGLTVAGILAAGGYVFARSHGWINGRR